MDEQDKASRKPLFGSLLKPAAVPTTPTGYEA